VGKKKLLPLRPETIVVGPFTFSVDWTVEGWSSFAASSARFDKDAALYYGFTDRTTLTFYVNPHAAEQFQREALLHEVTHGCQMVAGLPNEGQVSGEDFITRVTPILYDTLKRNPDLREYLFGEE
jgi:hypothetical protein